MSHPMTRAEAIAYRDRIGAVLNELDAIRNAFPRGPVFNALSTAKQAAHGAGQELHDLITGSVTGQPLT